MKKLGMRGKHVLAGWMFVTPWLLGFLFFFLQPVGNFLYYSFFTYEMQPGGYVLHPLENPFYHYDFAWNEDVKYKPAFVSAFEHFAYAVPVIVVFSLFCALLLNQDFKGRSVMRAIFFLPVIVTTGVFGLITTRGMAIAGVEASASTVTENIFDVSLLTSFLIESGIPAALVDFLSQAVSSVASLIWNSGVQILIFLIGLLSIPESYYEAARVEGATGWEAFWKITFPVVSPFILANLIYTFITECMSTSNGVMIYVSERVSAYQFSQASAMLWMYFGFMLLIIAVVFLLGSKLIVSSR